MKVLIVEKARDGARLRIGGIAADGSRVRLVPAGSAPGDWGREWEIGDVWEVEGAPAEPAVPPHVEDLAVRSARKVRAVGSVVPSVERFQPPVPGGLESLFEGLLQRTPAGALYVTEETGLPARSSVFWRPDQALTRTVSGSRVFYQYGQGDQAPRLEFTGFPSPAEEIPAGTLLCLALSSWQRPDEHPEEEGRCFLQLSGWLDGVAPAQSGAAATPRAPRPEVDLEAARALMERIFGYPEFRPLQSDIISAVLSGRDALGVMPTGAGKSLCYQIPALLLPGLTVVVSPLLSLMQDQIDQLREVGAPAVTLNSSLTGQAYYAALQSVRSGEAKLLYVAPETLVRPETRELLAECRVSCLTVDEAHCISEWGHDFRPEYRRIREIRMGCPGAVCLALTATATARVQDDIRTTLGIPSETTFVAGFDRPNLYLEVEPRGNAVEQILQVIAAHPEQSGIIYCSTRDQVDTLVSQFAAKGVQALPYHAGLPDATRRENQRLFQRDEVPVIVATIAFGMGINKPNVRFIAHHSLPDCLETYYQQVGRAGRDGLRSDCILFFSRGDVGTIHHFIEQSNPAERQGKIARLQAMLRYAGATGCRRVPLLSYFDDTPPEAPCGMCDNCLAEADGRERVDVSEDARLFLECVMQTGQRFGRAHLVDVLRGSSAARIVKFRHDQLPTHGKGRHRSEETWRLLADRFIEAGIVEAETERGTLRLTAASRAVLDGEPVLVILEEPKPTSTAGRPAGHDTLLFESLRKLRKQLADEAGVPPYVIFSDRSLIEMAATYPQTQSDFLRVHGVGERRAATYGEAFLAVIQAHVAERGVKEFSFTPTAAPPAAPVRGKRAEEVGSAFASGSSITELQEQWGVTRDTVVGHLVTYVRTGGVLEPDRLLAESLVPEPTRTEVLATFERLGDERLAPVFGEFGGAVPYAELHLLRAYRAALALRSE